MTVLECLCHRLPLSALLVLIHETGAEVVSGSHSGELTLAFRCTEAAEDFVERSYPMVEPLVQREEW